MMAAVCYVGDEVSAAGFRLAGADVRIAGSGRWAQALAEAMALAELVLVSAAAVHEIPPAELERALSALSPRVLVVPDLAGASSGGDLAQRLRVQLGLDT